MGATERMPTTSLGSQVRDFFWSDPNTTWTVIDQGRAYRTPAEMNEAIRLEMERLAKERKGLVEGVKKLDQAMITLRAASAQAPAIDEPLREVLQRLAGIRTAVG